MFRSHTPIRLEQHHRGSDWGVAFPVTNSIGLHHTPVDREVWVNGGPNIEFIHTNRRLELKLNYTVKNNKSYEPAYTHPNADAFANELRAGLGNEIINQYDIICFWVHGGGNGVAGLAPINRNTIVLHRPAPDTFAHEAAIAILAAAGPELLLPHLSQVLRAAGDLRGVDAYPARIAAAEAVLNDYRLTSEAIRTIVPALTVGADPYTPIAGSESIRKQAVLA